MLRPHWEKFKEHMPKLKMFDAGLDRYSYMTTEEYKMLRGEIGPNKPSLLRMLLSQTTEGMMAGVASFVDAARAFGDPEEDLRKTVRGQIKALLDVHPVALWESCGRRVLKPEGELFEMLQNTEASCPIEMVRPPFTSLYIEYPAPIHHVSSGAKFVGAYVSVTPSELHLLNDSRIDPNRLNVAAAKKYLIRNPYMKNDYCLNILSISETEEGETYQTLLSNMSWNEGCGKSVEQLINSKDNYIKLDDAMFGEERRDRIRMVTNLFLFMSSPHNDTMAKPGKFRSMLKDAKNRGERKRLLRLAEKEMETHDHILGSTIRVSHAAATVSGGEGSGGYSVRPHWRKGHFRAQWVGSFNTPERKQEPRWIMPTIVKRNTLESEEAEPGEYILD